MSLPIGCWYIPPIYHSIFLSLSKFMIRIYWCACWFTRQLPYFLKKVCYIFVLRSKNSLLKMCTSFPRKYFNISNYLISNSLAKYCLKVYLSSSSFSVMMMSTYTYQKSWNSSWIQMLDEQPMISLTLFMSHVFHYFCKPFKPHPWRLF